MSPCRAGPKSSHEAVCSRNPARGNLPTLKTNFAGHGKSIANRCLLALVGTGHIGLEGKRLEYLFSDLADRWIVLFVRRDDGDLAERSRIEGRLVLCRHRLYFLADFDHRGRRLGPLGPHARRSKIGIFAAFSASRHIFS